MNVSLFAFQLPVFDCFVFVGQNWVLSIYFDVNLMFLH